MGNHAKKDGRSAAPGFGLLSADGLVMRGSSSAVIDVIPFVQVAGKFPNIGVIPFAQTTDIAPVSLSGLSLSRLSKTSRFLSREWSTRDRTFPSPFPSNGPPRDRNLPSPPS
jgi:hypothetical protein